MREYGTADAAEVPDSGNLTDAVLDHARHRPDIALFAVWSGAEWTDVSAADFHATVRETAKGLVASGVRAGDRVALLSRTRYEWSVLDYAIWYAGGVSVPIYATSSEEQVSWILRDSGCRHVVVESAARLAQLMTQVQGDLTGWSIDEGPSGPVLEQLREAGASVSDADLDSLRDASVPSTVATLIYTSGTTGPPKGCVLTHGNFLFESWATTQELAVLFDGEDASTLLVLPLAHVFARIVQLGAVQRGVKLGHSTDVRRLMDDLASFQPTFLLGVPRLFETIFTRLSQQATAEGRGRAFDRATDAAISYSQELTRGRPGAVARARHAVLDRRVYRGVREALGDRCSFAFSGGAPLGERLTHFFRGAGLEILEGYGLTETSGASTVNAPGAQKIGTVGRPLPGVSVRVDDDGELLVRGPHLMRGYWQNPVATESVLASGWFRTGDLGEIDSEGFVRVTGRKKELLVTTGGKNVAPGQLEQQVCEHRLVSQCLVVGDGRPYIAALVTLDTDAYQEWSDRSGKRGPLADHTRDPELRREIQSAIDQANASVSQAESIRRFAILPVDWTEESGALTPSRKLRRNVVLREFRAEVRALYEQPYE